MSAPLASGLSVSVCKYEGLKGPTTRTAKRTSKNNSFNKQNNNFALASYCLVHFFPVLHDYDVKMPYFASALWRT